jgi:hypothetical protein
MLKKIHLLSISLLVTLPLLIALPSLAQTSTQTDAGSRIKQGIIDTGVAAELGNADTDVREVIALIISALLGFLGIIFTVLIMYGGWLWMTAAGNEQQIEKAKKVLSQATIGLFIVIASYGLSKWIFEIIRQSTYNPY